MGCIVDLFSHEVIPFRHASVGYVPVRMSLSAIVIMLKTQITTLINLPLFGSTHCTSGAFVAITLPTQAVARRVRSGAAESGL